MVASFTCTSSCRQMVYDKRAGTLWKGAKYTHDKLAKQRKPQSGHSIKKRRDLSDSANFPWSLPSLQSVCRAFIVTVSRITARMANTSVTGSTVKVVGDRFWIMVKFWPRRLGIIGRQRFAREWLKAFKVSVFRTDFSGNQFPAGHQASLIDA